MYYLYASNTPWKMKPVTRIPVPAAFCILLVLSMLHLPGMAQSTYRQVIRGKVIDKISRLPLPGANVVLVDSDPLNGCVSNIKGEFTLANVTVGRQSILVSYMGYRNQLIENISVTSGKEVILTIEMEESLVETGEVVIRAEARKDLPVNEMALISARSFNVEETERYAGSVGDPSRMASNFAGVGTLGDQHNEIVIRGNSPMGLMWRLNGVDIPNPNHFGSLATTGGGICMINNNLLARSDFFTGGFPAEYTNAMSGVFDLNMRTGNNETYEFTAQVGFNGLEFGAEGPFSKNHVSSFLLNYRYSMLLLVDKILGTDKFAIAAVPYYQDLSFKLDFPGAKSGRFSLTGIGGMSGIQENDTGKDTADWTYTRQGNDYTFGSRMGAVILSHTFYFTERTRLETDISLSGINSFIKEDTFTITNQVPYPRFRQHATESTLQFSTSLLKKINSRNHMDMGIDYRIMFNDFLEEQADMQGELNPAVNFNGTFSLVKLYMQWQHHFSEKLVINSGISHMFFPFNRRCTLDPRFSLKWNMKGNHSLSLGAGIFSQLPERIFYVIETPLDDGTVAMTNTNTGFMHSLHGIAGYDFPVKKNLRIKAETYIQYLFSIPVREPQPAYSMLNYGADDPSSAAVIDSLTNEGSGFNYGIELTVEHFLNRGFYFLVTGSLFESHYRGFDQVTRNTAFNNNFVLNLLAGKEFTVREKNFLTIDCKLTWAGGMRFIPFHTEQAGEQYYIRVDEWEHAYKERRPDYFRINLRTGYRVNMTKATLEVAVELLNLTNHRNVYYEMFDPTTGEIKTFYQFPFLPVGLIRVLF